MSELEFDRTRTHTTQDFDTSDVEPNRATPSSRLDAPAQPVASGILHRKARDANGVADGADAAVAGAAGTTGFALPETLMRKFEGSLDADLSSVRVHDDAQSHAAADAVGAKAYTVGNDIHFGAGEYNPTSGAGEHLLAHEVAHTVQQEGSTPTRQNKLEVSSPHDAAEHEADRAADAMVSGGTFAVSRAAGSTSRSVQRLNKTVPTPGWGGTNNGRIDFNPNASVSVNGQNRPYWFQTAEREECEVTPDSRGTIVIHNPYYWNFDELVTTPGVLWGTNTTHKTSFGQQLENSVSATYTVDKDGKIAFSSVSENGSVGVPPLFEGSTKATATPGDEGSLLITTLLKCTRTVATSNGTTSESGSNVSIDVKPEGVGAGYGRTSADGKNYTNTVTQGGTGQVQKTYGIILKVKKTPVAPPQSVTQKIVFDQEGKFLSGDDGINDVHAWWGRIPEPVRKQIMLGQKPVWLQGNASHTGTPTRNEGLVKDRLTDVTRHLTHLTPGMKIVPWNNGQVADEKSVIIKVEYTADEAKAP